MSKGTLANVGHDWDLDVEVLRERRRHDNDRRRYSIALGVLGVIAIGIAGLGWHGLTSKDYVPISGFWTAAGPIFGTIIGYYFGKQGDDR